MGEHNPVERTSKTEENLHSMRLTLKVHLSY